MPATRINRRPAFWAVLVMAWATISCQKLEDVEPPVFDGAALKAAVQGPRHVALSWPAAVDNFLPPEELAYGVWLTAADEFLDLATEPDFLTGEGARSYNLADLTPASAYRVVVRARDRQGNYSDNQDAILVETKPDGEGLIEGQQTLDLNADWQVAGEAAFIFKGRAFSGVREDLAVAWDRAVYWYEGAASGFSPRRDRTIRLEGPLVDARMTLISEESETDGRQDLLLQTETRLFLYRKRTGGYVLDEDARFPNGPLAGTLDVVERDGRLRALGFVDRVGAFRLYSRDDDGALRQERAYAIGGRDLEARMALLDDDEREDLIFFRNGELFRALDQGADFRFGPAGFIDAVAENDIGRGAYDAERVIRRLFAVDVDGDGFQDACLFLRNGRDDATQLWIYYGDGEGGFGDRRVVDYGARFYERPSFQRIDGRWVFTAPQTASNNIAAYSLDDLSRAAAFFGGFGPIEDALFGVFGDAGRSGAALWSKDGRKITVQVFSGPVAAD